MFTLPLIELGAEENKLSITPSLFSELEARGLHPYKQLLAGVDSGLFPYNILVHIPARENSAEADTVITAICQDDAAALSEDLFAFISRLSEDPPAVNSLILLSALDYPVLPVQESPPLARGTTAFLEQTENQDMLSALIPIPSTRFDEQTDALTLIPGAGKETAPSWLISSLPFKRIRSFLLFYRHGLVLSDERLALFLGEEIPSAGICYNPGDPEQKRELFSGIETFIRNYSRPEGNQWDRHYDVLPGLSGMFILENTFVRIFAAAIAISLFVLCGFAFLTGADREKNRSDFFKTFYLVPATVIIAALMLMTGQALCRFVAPQLDNLFLILTVKISITLILVSLFFILLIRLHLPVSQVVYGILMTLMAITNIFIFSAIDVTLIALFTLEYLIVVLAGNARRLGSLILAALALCLPFVPYIHDLSLHADYAMLSQYAQSNFTGNILLACILVPLLIMWLKIQIRILIFLKSRNISFKPLIPISTGVTAALGLIFFLYFSNPRFLPRSGAQASVITEIVDNESTELASISTSEEYFLELKTITLSIDANLPLIRCDITVSSQTGTPIYDAEYLYESARNAVIFRLPEYPPEPFTLTYTANNTEGMTVRADIYLLAAEGKAIKETHLIPIISSPPLSLL